MKRKGPPIGGPFFWNLMRFASEDLEDGESSTKRLRVEIASYGELPAVVSRPLVNQAAALHQYRFVGKVDIWFGNGFGIH